LIYVYFNEFLQFSGILDIIAPVKHLRTSQEEGAVAQTNSIVRGATATPSAASALASAADLAWERYQEEAAIAFRAGDPITSSRLWAAALDIAEKHLGRGDPRLASSLTNQALVMRRRRHDYQAQKLFHQALDVWDASWRWIYLMTPGRTAGAAPRSDHLDIYERDARAWFNALTQQGRAATEALECHDKLPANGLDEWFAIKPKRMSDVRRLLGAVLLIAPKPRA
jgi:hypothetical protein